MELDQKALAAQAWRDLEISADATGKLEVAHVTLPIEKVRALVAERRSLAAAVPADIATLVTEWRKAMEHVTPGPWRVYDGCSWRRIGTAHGKHDDCAVVYPYNAPDGHPDLGSARGNDTRSNLAWIARCSPDSISVLLDALTASYASLAAVEKDRDTWRDNFSAMHRQAMAAEASLAEARKALEAEREAVIQDVLQTVGECLAGQTHEHVSVLARRKIEAAIRAARRAHKGGADHE